MRSTHTDHQTGTCGDRIPSGKHPHYGSYQYTRYTSVEFTSVQQQYHLVEYVVDTYATMFSRSPGHALQHLLPVEDGQRYAHGVGTKPSDPGMTNTVATRSGTMPIGNMRTAAVSAVWVEVFLRKSTKSHFSLFDNESEQRKGTVTQIVYMYAPDSQVAESVLRYVRLSTRACREHDGNTQHNKVSSRCEKSHLLLWNSRKTTRNARRRYRLLWLRERLATCEVCTTTHHHHHTPEKGKASTPVAAHLRLMRALRSCGLTVLLKVAG